MIFARSVIYIQYILHLSQNRVTAERVLQTLVMLVRVKTHKHVFICAHVCESMYPRARGWANHASRRL